MRRPPCRGFAFAAALWAAPASAGAEEAPGTWAERLGYPAGKKVLLLHADDIGMCHEANQAAKDYFEGRRIQSASVMVPCPWFDEFASWAKERPDLDVGLHLAHTSEWKHYRWGPVAPRSEVPGLVDADGYMPRGVMEVALKATAAEVEKEIRAQIEKSLARGLRPGHLDTHMGTLYSRPDYARVFLKVAEEYRIPALAIEMKPAVIESLRKRGYPLTDEIVALSKAYTLPKLDDFHSVPEARTYEEKREKLLALIRSLSPGITEIIFHPSVETECLKSITGSWKQRSWEAKLFADAEVLRFFEAEGILFTSWKEMMRRHEKKKEGVRSVPEGRNSPRRHGDTELRGEEGRRGKE